MFKEDDESAITPAQIVALHSLGRAQFHAVQFTLEMLSLKRWSDVLRSLALVLDVIRSAMEPPEAVQICRRLIELVKETSRRLAEFTEWAGIQLSRASGIQ